MKYLAFVVFCLGAVIFLSSTLSCAEVSQSQPSITVTVDPRVELMCIIARLAGYDEYMTGEFPAYVADVDSFFSSFRNHDVVSFARTIRPRGIGFEKVMQMAIAVTDAYTMQEIISLDSLESPLSKHWRTDDAREFLQMARRFAAETNFRGFIDRHKALYDTARSRFLAVAQSTHIAEWLTEYFGYNADCNFEIILGLQIGNNNYGASLARKGGRGTIYSFIGVASVDAEGWPEFYPGVNETVLHEMAHSFVNPLTKDAEPELKSAGERIYPHVASAMARMAYNDWRIMLNESLVRAIGIRHEDWRYSAREASIIQEGEEERGFYWIGGLSELLTTYEAQRSSYPDFKSFFPRIVAYLNQYSLNVPDEIQKLTLRKKQAMARLEAHSPKIVSINPPDGAQDVDPLLRFITVVFDRPMRGGYSVMTRGRGMGEAPVTRGECRWDSTKTVFAWPVTLQPDTEYGFSLNGKWNLEFQSVGGDPLVPTLIRFKTR